MKVRKAKKRFEPKPKLQPKRVDINTHQRTVLDVVYKAEETVLTGFETLLGEVLGGALQKSPTGFWNPESCAYHLGVSPASFENYIMHYLRVVRRTDESAKDYRLRKRSVFTEESPESQSVKPMGRTINTRILLWCVIGPTKTGDHEKGHKHLELREKIVETLGLELGSKRKIKKHETQVTHFQVKEQ